MPENRIYPSEACRDCPWARKAIERVTNNQAQQGQIVISCDDRQVTATEMVNGQRSHKSTISHPKCQQTPQPAPTIQ